MIHCESGWLLVITLGFTVNSSDWWWFVVLTLWFTVNQGDCLWFDVLTLWFTVNQGGCLWFVVIALWFMTRAWYSFYWICKKVFQNKTPSITNIHCENSPPRMIYHWTALCVQYNNILWKKNLYFCQNLSFEVYIPFRVLFFSHTLKMHNPWFKGKSIRVLEIPGLSWNFRDGVEKFKKAVVIVTTLSLWWLMFTSACSECCFLHSSSVNNLPFFKILK